MRHGVATGSAPVVGEEAEVDVEAPSRTAIICDLKIVPSLKL